MNGGPTTEKRADSLGGGAGILHRHKPVYMYMYTIGLSVFVHGWCCTALPRADFGPAG